MDRLKLLSDRMAGLENRFAKLQALQENKRKAPGTPPKTRSSTTPASRTRGVGTGSQAARGERTKAPGTPPKTRSSATPASRTRGVTTDTLASLNAARRAAREQPVRRERTKAPGTRPQNRKG